MSNTRETVLRSLLGHGIQVVEIKTRYRRRVVDWTQIPCNVGATGLTEI